MKILLVEDAHYKQADAAELVASLRNPDIVLMTADSVRSAFDYIDRDVPDMIWLDMTLPEFSHGTGHNGFSLESFGGKSVLEYLERYEKRIPVVVFTQLAHFFSDRGEVPIDSLDSELSRHFRPNYRGFVSYSPFTEQWKRDLTEHMHRVYKECLDDKRSDS